MARPAAVDKSTPGSLDATGGHLVTDWLESWTRGERCLFWVSALMKHAEELQGDLANYTDVGPVIQVSEVLISR